MIYELTITQFPTDTYQLLAEEVLLDLLKERDEKVFTMVYNRYWALLHRFSQRLLRDEDLATDTVQDIFARLWEHAPGLHVNGSLSNYLYGAARNYVIQHIRKEKVRENYLNQLPPDEGACITDELIREKELRQLFEREVENLPPKMREIYELSRKRYLSYKEIAEKINISEGTVKKQIYNAIKLLRTKLSSYFFLCLLQAILWLSRHF